MVEDILDDAESRMTKSLNALEEELGRIRTGRANTSLLDHIEVEYYGSMVPISQVANLAVEDARTLAATPWEQPMVKVVEKAIMESDLGLNPSTAGNIIRIPLPPLTEERRIELVKLVKKEGENCKVAMRNIRRDAISDFKSLEKEKDISQDECRNAEDNVQKIIDSQTAKVDALVEAKEKEMMDV